MRISDDEGFTLVEMLAAIIIAALLTSSVAAVVSYASSSLSHSVDGAISTQATLRSLQLMRFDFAGSESVYAYGATAPSVTTLTTNKRFCSSDSTLGNWGSSSNWGTMDGFVRPLITLDVVDLDQTTPALWMPSSHTLVTYEIRHSTAGSDKTFSLWRVVCANANSAVTSQERLVTLTDTGTSISEPIGTSLLTCYSSSTLLPIPAGCREISDVAGDANGDYYSFKFPYPATGTSAALRALTNPSNNILRPRVGK